LEIRKAFRSKDNPEILAMKASAGLMLLRRPTVIREEPLFKSVGLKTKIDIGQLSQIFPVESPYSGSAG